MGTLGKAKPSRVCLRDWALELPGFKSSLCRQLCDLRKVT